MSPHIEHIWRGLPQEILVSNVLPRLPMASLCRFRAVCKKWNALPMQSDFAAQHALVSLAEEEFVFITFAKEFVLITLRLMQPANSIGGWYVLDVANSKDFPVSVDLFATPARCGSIIPALSRKFLVADGALLFVCLFGNSNGPSLIVCNPILKAVKMIPSPLGEWFQSNPHVMFTNTVSMEYEILVFHLMEYHYQTKYMDVFESKTGTWRRVVNTSMTPSPPWRLCQRSKFVKFKNALYQLHGGVKSDEDWKPYLIKFDKTTGVGSIFDFPKLFLSNKDCTRGCTLYLVVSMGQLFCIYRPQWKHDDDCVEVFEVFPEQHMWESLVKMPKALLHWLHSNLEEELDFVMPIECASSILFSSSVVGRFVAYDLARKSWHQYSHTCPPHLLKQQSDYWPRTNFGLSLCPP